MDCTSLCFAESYPPLLSLPLPLPSPPLTPPFPSPPPSPLLPSPYPFLPPLPLPPPPLSFYLPSLPSPPFSPSLHPFTQCINTHTHTHTHTHTRTHTHTHTHTHTQQRGRRSTSLTEANPRSPIKTKRPSVRPPDKPVQKLEQFDSLSQHKKGFIFRRKVSIANMLQWTKVC